MAGLFGSLVVMLIITSMNGAFGYTKAAQCYTIGHSCITYLIIYTALSLS